MESAPKTEDQAGSEAQSTAKAEPEVNEEVAKTIAPASDPAAPAGEGEANANPAPPLLETPTATTTTEVKEEQKTKDGTQAQTETDAATPVPTQATEAPSTGNKEEPRPRRRYNKVVLNDDGLSGSYWKTPAPAVVEDTSITSASSRPRRSNAGSLMKTALQELDRKQKATSPAKAASGTTPTKTPTEGRGGRRSTGGKDKDKDKDATAPSAAPIARKSEPSGGGGFRVGPYEKPVTRGRGRPGRHRKADDDEDEEEDDDAEFEPADKKAKGGRQSQSEKLTPTKTPTRTYGRRSTTAAATPEEKPQPQPRQPITKTYSRRRPSQRTEEMEPDSDSGTGAARVSPSTALIAALSIPDELLPTSHEKFLDKFRETQEKSPTPPERRVHNLDEVVATFKSSSSRSKVKEAVAVGIGESEQNTPADSSAESEGDSESGSSPSDDKENVGGSASGVGGSGGVASLTGGGSGKSAQAAAAAAAEDAARVQLLKWAEDVKPTVVKLGENQLSINDVVVTIDYTNYLKESDVEVLFDYDVVFQPEPALENPTPPDLLPAAGAVDALVSNPPSPAVKPSQPEEVSATTTPSTSSSAACVLEACAMGCVCKGLKRPSPRAEHCGRPKCFLECSCLFNHHVLIKGDGQNIRDRLRTRVKLLNWKSITNNGGREHPDERGEGGSSGKKHKLHKKDRGGKGKKGRESRDSEGKRHKKGGDAAAKAAPQKLTRGQLQAQQALAQAQVYKPGPKSSKPAGYANANTGLSPGKGAGARSRAGASNAGQGGQFKAPKRPPPLISTRYASNLPILRRIYSCQPCHVQLTKMPKKWSHWSTVESKCASLVPRRVQPPGGGSGSVPFHVATSNFKVAAQGDLSYTIVRPNGSILALLYWEAHTKEAPRSIHPHAGGSSGSSEISYPWLYLPLPSSGKVWLFYEIPKYPNDLPAIFLPELGVFLPTDKLMLMTFEANQTGKTSKLYFERNDESKMTEQGLLNFVYLVPNLPSLIVYGPVPKNCLKTVTRRAMEKTLRAFEDSDECKQMRRKLAEAGTDVEEVGGGGGGEEQLGGFSGLKYAPEYEDDFVRDSDLIGESIWETHYQDFIIPANGYEDEDANGEGEDDEFPYDFEAGEEIYTDEDGEGEGEGEGSEEELWEVVREPGGQGQDQLGQETYAQLQQGDHGQGQEPAEVAEGEAAEDESMADWEDESEFQELEEITLMDLDEGLAC